MDGVTASSTPKTGLRPAFWAAFFHLTQPKVEAVSVIGAWAMPISVRRAMTSSILPTADLKLYPVLTLTDIFASSSKRSSRVSWDWVAHEAPSQVSCVLRHQLYLTLPFRINSLAAGAEIMDSCLAL